jgi:hypothetical protein
MAQQVSWHPLYREPKEDKADTRIRFNDVVFGIVIAKIFNEAESIEKLTWSDRTHLFLAFAVTIGSYIGYRKSLKRSTYTLAFFNLPLWQFILDLGMIYFYYRLSATPDFTANVTPKPTVDPNLDAIIAGTIFALYFAWDIVSYFMSERRDSQKNKIYPDIKFSFPRTAVTFLFLALAVIVAAAANFTEFFQYHFHDKAIAVDLSLAVAAIAYRWAKDGLY